MPSLAFVSLLDFLWDKNVFSHQFLVMTESPRALLEETFWTQVAFPTHEDNQATTISRCHPTHSNIPHKEIDVQAPPTFEFQTNMVRL